VGKRSNFERVPRDFYPTPPAAVLPLIPYLRGIRTFAEPCAGAGALVRHLESHGLCCVYQGDIADGRYGDADAIITNPPYERKALHALIGHFARIAPAWLLLETDWAFTKQAAPFMSSCSDIVSVGRLRWIEGTTMSGKQNFAWYRFDTRHLAGPIFHAHGSVPVSSRASLCGQCGKPYRPQRSSSKFCSDTCRQRAHRSALSVTKRDTACTQPPPMS
jgi:hypothetical protein